MVELSSLLFKPVIERDTSNVVGRIKNAYFSQGCTTIAYFVVSSCKQGCDALLPIADVLCFSDAIVVQNDANVRCIDDVDFTLFSNGIIGMEVYTQNGILKGKIQKVEFAKGGKVSKLCTENEQFTPQNVACVGDVILLKSTKQGKAKKAVIPRPEKETTVLALKENKKKQITDLSDESVPLLQNETEKTVSCSSQVDVDFAPIRLANAPMAIKTTAPEHKPPPRRFALFFKQCFKDAGRPVNRGGRPHPRTHYLRLLFLARQSAFLQSNFIYRRNNRKGRHDRR